jgi:hypothetical protein
LAVPASATPVAGRSVDVAPAESIKAASVKCPGEAGFAKLTAPRQIPLGCEVDATNGGLSITTARADGTTQSGQFGGLRIHFKITQDGDVGVVTLSEPPDCSGRAPTLFVAAQGLFRTVARYGSATGTGGWQVEQGCNATTTFSAGDRALEIRDFPARKTVQLRPERSYIAGGVRSCGNLSAMPTRSAYAAINIAVSGVTCARAKSVILAWLKRLPPYKGKKTKPFPTSSGGWTFDGTLVSGARSRATRGVASTTFNVILTFFA